MAGSLEERVAVLEGRMEEQSRNFGLIGQRIEDMSKELGGRINELSGRIEALDERLTGRIDALDQKVSRQFVWLVSFQFTVLVAVIAALAGR